MHDFAPGRPGFLQTPYPGFASRGWTATFQPSVARSGMFFRPIRACFSFETIGFPVSPQEPNSCTPPIRKAGGEKSRP